MRLLQGDKKTRSGVRSFVLPTGIGTTQIVKDVSDAELLAATESMLLLMRAHSSKTDAVAASKKRKS